MSTPPPQPGILVKDWRDWAERFVQWIMLKDQQNSGMVAIPKYPIGALPKAVGYGIIMVQDVSSVYPAYSDGTEWKKFSDNTAV